MTHNSKEINDVLSIISEFHNLIIVLSVGKSDTFMLDAFRWFGTYLAWIPDEFAKTSIDGRGTIKNKKNTRIFFFFHLFNKLIFANFYLVKIIYFSNLFYASNF